MVLFLLEADERKWESANATGQLQVVEEVEKEVGNAGATVHERKRVEEVKVVLKVH